MSTDKKYKRLSQSLSLNQNKNRNDKLNYNMSGGLFGKSKLTLKNIVKNLHKCWH